MQAYCNSLTAYSRLKTREVKIGDLLMGNLHPVRVQTMTTTDTMDTIATVEQTIRCIEAGAELVRITAPSKKDAENLLNIKNELHARGYTTPLVADIHFTPNAAEIAARIVEKVRVNPGNYVDKKKFEQIEYSDAEYAEEINRIRDRFTPLIKICKEYGTAMRIGTNHGSLSDRIMSRYGDTPMGMVESAMEFLRIARDENYHNIVLSMKASNTLVMVQAYRLLVNTMFEEFGEIYPLHLGVTEAGDGEDGRIKSAVGIGTLMEDGLGDTIRVSLTEDPEFEIPVCKDLVKRYENRDHHSPIAGLLQKIRSTVHRPSSADEPNGQRLAVNGQRLTLPYNPFEYKRRITNEVNNIGGALVPIVVAGFLQKEKINVEDLKAIGYNYDAATDKWNIGDSAADYLYTGNKTLDFNLPGTLKIICNAGKWLEAKSPLSFGEGRGEVCFPLFEGVEYLDIPDKSSKQNFVAIDVHTIDKQIKEKIFDQVATDVTAVLCLYSTNKHSMADVRRNMIELMDRNIKTPVIICVESHFASVDEQLIQFSAEAGALLLDGFGDGVWLVNDPKKLHNTKVSGRNYIPVASNHQFLNATAFSILQATRTRISKTEYISCPSCGRTLFELQETTAKIRAVTNHLKGVKIAIMGCIVNGPGEMADADFGYVGSGVGKITLYKGKEVIKRNVDSHVAVDELIGLIKDYGAWIDPS
ncbi:(E)-4-hydroxy-3-methylbut-2-enyl-diphosphate synthase [Parafilimonas sp.]|uniref:(E)-4-hydroxy-3-methylbut-2-enyl-diphosphate synthase n=1 Tax=Parafilimonas sp. TaxID=1969739 RepID=UPI0039E58A57